ncbi:helix-turn-helix transcriptional regulator [Escherichia coli]|uniref:helix-turn-helix transcriptional regulator n=1 Tax=Escherichia coli TaxID=562 RepID=UPI0015E46C91|nr:AlpA family phage regulatory protein [Escherichia coli]EFN2001128.1 AlpA family phage regulatory protein [Escherichia coli]MBA1061983.1 AlpA family phage regulatory protein [Escherichia coli]MCU0051510.1 AlpA family phage regulatory protein [Escherichia coli]HBA4925608.1 AlpA family phage regulatory protein [Escherichia coli]HBA5159031.1 AlpA family phage regulatory protein [Escherichia coli]
MEAIRKIIFRQEVKKIIHIKADSTLQSMINAGEFPQGFRVGLRRRGWYEDDVLAWQKEREQEARGTTA